MGRKVRKIFDDAAIRKPFGPNNYPGVVLRQLRTQAFFDTCR
jgi:hypothetical protein